jgi:hypothetical protein
MLVTGSVDGTTVTLKRVGRERVELRFDTFGGWQRLDGLGEGYFLHHMNLNMKRSRDAKPRDGFTQHNLHGAVRKTLAQHQRRCRNGRSREFTKKDDGRLEEVQVLNWPDSALTSERYRGNVVEKKRQLALSSWQLAI